jgi:hypothetical protein
MEDWAYAAGWENSVENGKTQPIKECQPDTFSGYSLNRTNYDNTQIKANIYLIETSDMKRPFENELGSDENLFDEGK